ncbi:cation:proton antiporter [Candidatus Bathyarchaeota archaeon]|nr:cation:proton antiporter [Candidatus Bathyarchaeota archaeon]
MAAMDVSTLFSLIGLFIIIGFIADIAFKKIGIPDLIVLVGLGLLVGPILGLIDVDYIRGSMHLISTLAIAIILFDGGLSFDIRSVISGASRAVILALLGFILSTISVTLFSILILNWDIHSGVLLGVIVSDTSSAVTIPIVTRLSTLNGRIASMLTLESVLTDVLVVVVGLTLIRIPVNLASESIIWMLVRETVSCFSIGCFSGIIAGLIWSKILEAAYREAYRDILTLSVALLLYGFVEILGGSGPISALSFGLTLGNTRLLKTCSRSEASIGVDVRTFQSQISFLVRTFLFVSIGVVSVFDDIVIVVIGLAISIILIITRYLAVRVSLFKAPLIVKLKTRILTFMVGRGLAAASIASLASYYRIPHSGEMYSLTVSIILFTVILSSIGAMIEKLSS